MHTNVFRKWFSVATTISSACLLFASPLAGTAESPTNLVSVANKSINDYLPSFPWIGLIMGEVSYGPITVSDTKINQGDRLAVVKPGDLLQGSLRYRVDSSHQHLFHRYHLVIGIKGLGAQDCVTHTYGIWDSKRKETFTLKAPIEPGVYEVRFCYQGASTCEEARSVWNETMGEPSSYATIGVVVVE